MFVIQFFFLLLQENNEFIASKIMKKKYVVLIIISLFILAICAWLSLPTNYYFRQALLHQHPKIDQYSIFENCKVIAGNPQPWELSAYYNQSKLSEQYVEDFESLGTVAYVVIQDGKLLFEHYWDDYSAQSYSNSFSMSKSLVSLAVGCAIDDGLIRNVNQPVSDFFPQFDGYNGKTLTIRHLLTMSAGFNFQESYSSIFSPTTKLYYGNDLNAITFGMKSIAEPGVNFIYQSGVTQLLASIVEKVTNENLCTYISKKIWTPLQAEEDALWSLDRKDGMVKAYCCFNSNARDFARIGQLILNEGVWNDKQIISQQYIQEATTADETLIDKECHEQDCNDTNKQYGFQFWTLERYGMKIPYMRGLLGQYIFVIPDRNAVVVRLGKQKMKQYTADQHYPADIDIWLNAAESILDNIPKRAHLVFAGDLMQNLPQVRAAHDNQGGGYDYSESFQFVKPVFQEADMAVVNLETTISATGNFTGFPIFRSPKELTKSLCDMGIDVAVLANNHAFDGGRQGVNTTLSFLDSVGIQHTGVFTDGYDFLNNHPLYLSVKGLQFALLNYTYGTNGLPVPEGMYINRIDTFSIVRDLQQIDRSTTDGVIVFFHWGNEYARYPNQEQIALAELCHRYGAEIVIGSHPHVVQPIAYEEDEEGIIRNVTVFSLGNLVSNQRNRYQDGGIIVAIDVLKAPGEPLELNIRYTPVWVQLPKYRILTINAAKEIALSPTERKAYQQFITDTNQLLRPDN